MTVNSSLVVSTRAHTGTLPTSVRTRGGAIFDPRANIWTYKDGVKKVVIDFSSVEALSPQMLRAYKAVLIWYAENASPSHLRNMHAHFIRLIRFLSANQSGAIRLLTKLDLLNYKASLTLDKAWYVGTLSGFIKKWHRLGYPGVTDDAVALLRDLQVRGNAKGVAVLTMDPLKGPYTEIEQQGIQDALNAAFAEGEITEAAFLLAWLFMALGQRPAQFAALKVSDISAVTIDGSTLYSIKIPRVKQRNAHPRAQLKDRPLVSQIGQPLQAYANRIRELFRDKLDVPENAPLFPCGVDGEWAAGYEYHHTGDSLAEFLKAAFRELQIPSERTGRKDVRQNEPYNHQSDRDVLALVRSVVGDEKRMHGPLARADRLALIPRDEFARLKVPTAHTTDFGYCIHDFTMLPCQIHRDCMNCDEQVCIKGDEIREANIRMRRAETAALLEQARSATAQGYAGANRWVEHQERTLVRFDKLCEMIDDPNVPVGSVIQPSGIVPASRLEQAAHQRGLKAPTIGLLELAPDNLPVTSEEET